MRGGRGRGKGGKEGEAYQKKRVEKPALPSLSSTINIAEFRRKQVFDLESKPFPKLSLPQNSEPVFRLFQYESLTVA